MFKNKLFIHHIKLIIACFVLSFLILVFYSGLALRVEPFKSLDLLCTQIKFKLFLKQKPPTYKIIAINSNEFKNQKKDFEFAANICKDYLEDKYDKVISIKLEPENIYKEQNIKNNKIIKYLIITDFAENWETSFKNEKIFNACRMVKNSERKWKLDKEPLQLFLK